MAVSAAKLKNESKDAFTKYLMVSTALNQNSGLFDFGNVLVQRSYLENEGVRIISEGHMSSQTLLVEAC